ncbi:MAG: 50S ribosomal protein L24 [Thermoplasmatales archaeon B_DKE]|nr:MAG: 50S ribosomal protein L24 [Thermoplasmatales archaeon B_DKE]QRF75992.1 50S ribosomal protein L24P [Thermoplasmatales archaeon]
MAVKNTFKVFLSKDLRKKYGIRSFSLAKGDIVTIEAGSKKGEGGKVLDINHVDAKVSIEGITANKADGKQKAFMIDPSNLKITRLDLSRQERLQKIKDLAARKNIIVEDEPAPAVEAPEAEIPEVPESQSEPEEETEEEKAEGENEDDQQN